MKDKSYDASRVIAWLFGADGGGAGRIIGPSMPGEASVSDATDFRAGYDAGYDAAMREAWAEKK
jgi:hypothetical protein